MVLRADFAGTIAGPTDRVLIAAPWVPDGTPALAGLALADVPDYPSEDGALFDYLVHSFSNGQVMSSAGTCPVDHGARPTPRRGPAFGRYLVIPGTVFRPLRWQCQVLSALCSCPRCVR